MGTKPQQQLQRAAEGGEPGLFADWQPSWRNPAASGNSRAARAGQDERTPLLEEQLAVLQREHNELRQAIFAAAQAQRRLCAPRQVRRGRFEIASEIFPVRSEEHTSELQSLAYLVCRLLLEKKKKKQKM